MIRKFSVILSLLLAISFMGGCGKAPVETPAEEQPDTSIAVDVSPEPEPRPVPDPKPEQPSEPIPPAGEEALRIIRDNFPVLDGSTSNMPLLAQIYSSVLGIPIEEAELYVNVSGGTGLVWDSMIRGKTDIAVVFEMPVGLEEKSQDLEIIPFGSDALVFLVNQSNPVKALSTEQLVSIYSGEYTNWNEVGGRNQEIVAFQRNEGSGSQTLFMKLLMKDKKPVDPPRERVSFYMGGLIDAVAAYDGSGAGAIGYSVYYYAGEMNKNPKLRILAIDGINPSPETIADGSYPLLNDFYIVINKSAPYNSPARLLRDWLLTDEGRKIIEAAGYIPAF